MYGGAFRGLGKRNRAAFKEAACVSNTRIARVRYTVGVLPDGKLGLIEVGVGETNKQTMTVESAEKEALRERVDLGDVTNVARRGEATPKAREVGVETRGKNDLPYIARARGDGLGGLVALCEMSAPLSDALKAGDVVHGVDFQEITSEIWQRVRLSATEETFLQWLVSRAQTYASTGVPQSIEALVSGVLLSDAATTGEFVPVVAGGREWRSPLNALESSFARLRFNAVHAAAKALNADEAELAAALAAAERESVSNVSRSRYYNVRANYLYAIAHGGIVYIYVGESMDPEARMNSHLLAILGDDAGHRLQRGHIVVRTAREGSANDSDMFAFRAWVLAGYDEASAVHLCKSYINFAGIAGRESRHILELARAIAGAGFAAEAVYTAQFRSLNDHSIDGVIGLNFSQPGMIHPQAAGQLDPTWRDIVESGRTAKKAKQPRAPFKCHTCGEIKDCIRRCWTQDGERNGNGELYEQCGSCNRKERRADRQLNECAGTSNVAAAAAGALGGHARADMFRVKTRNATISIEEYWDATEKGSHILRDKHGLLYKLEPFVEQRDYLSKKRVMGRSVIRRSRVVLVRDGPESTIVRAKMFFNVKEANTWLGAHEAENLFGCVQPSSRVYHSILARNVKKRRDRELRKKNNARGN
jgi:hypothetical protein